MKFSGKVKTITEAMITESPTIGTFQREKGKGFTEGLIMMWLVYLNDLLNLNKPMTEDQIEMCATEITNEYYALKFSDLTLLYKRIISGSYGEFYESLSIPKVLSFFRQYFEERCDIAYDQSLRDHKNMASEDTFSFSKNIKRVLRGDKTK